MRQKHLLIVLIVLEMIIVAWSGYRPRDYGVWVFELVPGTVGVLVLAATYRRFRFSNLVYVLVFCHYAILAVGAKYTYAEMPLFNWLKDVLDLSRNHYDRVGHFAQGFVPAVIAREILIRLTPLHRGRMLCFLTVSVCLAIIAFYELLEMWMVKVFYPTGGADWLGLQGDIWDSQWDMTMAMIGAVCAYLLLRRLHDRFMAMAATPKVSDTQT